MRKQVNMKVAIPAMIIILVLLIVYKVFGVGTLSSGMKLGFAGNSTFHTYEGSYSKIIGIFSHSLTPSKNSDEIACVIKTKSGSLTVTITEKESGETIYEETVTDSKSFAVPASGKVKIVLKTGSHSGSYKFTY